MDWIPISDLNITSEIKAIHCDTRDFHCGLSTDNINFKDGDNRQITKVFYNNDYNIEESKVKDWLLNLFNISGGKAVWRYLEFDSENCKNWNVKYIRLYRNPKRPNMFVVCNRLEIPIKYKECTEETLNKEQLNLND